MAAPLSEWLGPHMERELKDLVDWKRRAFTRRNQAAVEGSPVKHDTVRDFSSEDFSHIFSDTGSVQTVHCTVGPKETDVVQIVEVLATQPVLKLVVSDGYTKIKARVERDALDKLLIAEKIDLSQIVASQMLRIPQFEIQATSFGRTEDRVSLLIFRVAMLRRQESQVFGNPRPVMARQTVIQTLAVLNGVNNKFGGATQKEGQVPASSRGESSGDAAGGTQQTLQSQAFASQAFTAMGGGHMVRRVSAGGVNLASPVLARRNDSQTVSGVRPAANRVAFGDPLNMDMFNYLPPRNPIHRVPGVLGRGGNGDIASRDNEYRGAVRGPTGAHNDLGSHAPTIDLTRTHSSDEEVVSKIPALAIEEDDVVLVGASKALTNSRDLAPSTRLREDASNHVEDAVVAKAGHHHSGSTGSDQRLEDIAHPHGLSEAATGSKSKMSDAKEAADARPSIWNGIGRLIRFRGVIPSDQEAVLNQPSSWNPPRDGRSFPRPNVPRALLESLERENGPPKPREGSPRTVSGDSSRPSTAGKSSAKAPFNDDTGSIGDGIPFDWSPSPSQIRPDLPPDSSAMDVTFAGANSSRGNNCEHSPSRRARIGQSLPPDSPTQSIIDGTDAQKSPRSPEHLSQPYQITTSQAQKLVPGFSPWQVPSSVINLEQNYATNGNQKVPPIEPSTLSEANFADESQNTRASRISQPSKVNSHGSSLEKREDPVGGSGYTPRFPSAQKLAGITRGNKDLGCAPSGRVPTAEFNAMAIESGRTETFESEPRKTPLADGKKPSLQSSPTAQTAYKTASEMDKVYKSPAKVLGKHSPSEPFSENITPKKSRFGFSQEEPVSQDPRKSIANERRSFLASRKKEKHALPNRTEEPHASNHGPGEMIRKNDADDEVEIPSSPPVLTIESRPRNSIQTSKSERAPGHITDASSPRRTNRPAAQARNPPLTFESLFAKFSTTYHAYKGNITHFKNLLAKVNELGVVSERLHSFLWDDFIVRSKTDYAPYSLECMDAGEEPMSYPAFYFERIKRPKHIEGVLTDGKLKGLFPTDLLRPDLSHHPAQRTMREPLDRRNAHMQESPWSGPTQPHRRSKLVMADFSSSSTLPTGPKKTWNKWHQQTGAPQTPKNFEPSNGAHHAGPNTGPSNSHVLPPNSDVTPSNPIMGPPARRIQSDAADGGPGGGRRSLPWSLAQQGRRVSGLPAVLPGPEPDLHRGQSSEYTAFHRNYRALSSVQMGRDDASEGRTGNGMGQRSPRTINVLGWTL